MEEFTSNYGSDEDGKYVLTRDLATYAIFKEVEAGRGSPHGGAYLSFEHCSAAALREAFGPVIDRLAANHIDLTKMPVEVAPIAHYHMGGVKADATMATDGARPLSSPAKWSAAPMAPTGSRATPSPRPWCSAAAPAQAPRHCTTAGNGCDLQAHDTAPRSILFAPTRRDDNRPNTAAMIARLQAIMADDVGPFRTGAKLSDALAEHCGAHGGTRRATARRALTPSICNGSNGLTCAT